MAKKTIPNTQKLKNLKKKKCNCVRRKSFCLSTSAHWGLAQLVEFRGFGFGPLGNLWA